VSGICGVLREDGRLADAGEIAGVLAAMAARGPDRSGALADGPAALGHALLATTPEAALEPMPLRHEGSGCIITADVRLDNRGELIAALGVDDTAGAIGDGELVLQAYLRWDTDCPTHLLGDFAFAIWDPRRQRLFCARDHVGMRQLITAHLPGKVFAFATDVEALLRHADVPLRINEARIADFLEDMEAIDLTSTFFTDCHRLPPAHALVIEQGRLRCWRYWQLTPGPIIRRSTDAAYGEAFLEVFTEAVRARMRSPGRVGSMLSGGLDSGSVTVVAARLLAEAGLPPLDTYSAIDPDPDCPESRAIRASLGIAHIAPHVIALGEDDSFHADIVRLTEDSIEPFDAHMVMIRALYLAAERDGIRVMLDGVAGDTSLPTGDMIAFHLGEGRVRKAWREARAQERFWDGEVTARRAFSEALKRVLVPARLREIRRNSRALAQAHRAAADSAVDPALATRIDMPERRRAHDRHTRVEHDCSPASQALRMLHPNIIVARERYDRVASVHGIEPRDPFLDIRVLAFCLTLPAEQLHADGWPKLLLRRVMRGALPDSVLWKTGRHHVGWRYINHYTSAPLYRRDGNTLSELDNYVRKPGQQGNDALRCSTKGLVTETYLDYLGNWIRRLHSLQE
jgi:asparagine synthase (glutamine-hydrolysing)